MDKYLAATSFTGSDDYNPTKSQYTIKQETKPDSSASRSTLLTDNVSSSSSSSYDDDDDVSGGDDGDNTPTTTHRPLCHQIFGCGSSHIHPTNEIRIKTSDLSSEIVHVQSEVSSCSSGVNDNQSRDDNPLLDSQAESNQRREESPTNRIDVGVNEEMSAVSQYQHKCDNVNPLHKKSSLTESGTRNENHDDRQRQYDMPTHLESANERSQRVCGIFTTAGEALHRISSCVGRLICHEEDDDLELISKLEKQESNRALSQVNPERIEQFRNSFITRSTYSIIKLDNLNDGYDLFDNESIFNKSSISLGDEGQIILSPSNRNEIFRDYGVDDIDGIASNTSQNFLIHSGKNNLSSTPDENIGHLRIESSSSDKDEELTNRQQRKQKYSVTDGKNCGQTPLQYEAQGSNHFEKIGFASMGECSDQTSLPYEAQGSNHFEKIGVASMGECSDQTSLPYFEKIGFASMGECSDQTSLPYEAQGSNHFEKIGFTSMGECSDQTSLPYEAQGSNHFEKIGFASMGECKMQSEIGSTNISKPNEIGIGQQCKTEPSLSNEHKIKNIASEKETPQLSLGKSPLTRKRYGRTRSDGDNYKGEGGKVISKSIDFEDNTYRDSTLELTHTDHDIIPTVLAPDITNEEKLFGTISSDNNRLHTTYMHSFDVNIKDDNADSHSGHGNKNSSSSYKVGSPPVREYISDLRNSARFTKDQLDGGQQVDFRDVVIQLEGVDGTRSAENCFISDDDDDDDNDGNEDREDDDTGNRSYFEKRSVERVEHKGESDDDDGSRSSDDTDDDDLVEAYGKAAHSSDAGLSSNIRPISEALSSRTVYAGTFTKDQLDGGQQIDFRDVVIQLEGVDGTRSTENCFISDDDDDDDNDGNEDREDDDTGNRSCFEKRSVERVEHKGESDDDDDDGSRSSDDADDDDLVEAYGKVAHSSDAGLSSNIRPISEALSSRTVYAGTFTKDQIDVGQQVDFRDVVIQLEGVNSTRSADNCFISDDDDDEYKGDDDVDVAENKGESDDDDDDGSTSSEETENDGLVAAYRRAAHSSDAGLSSNIRPISEALSSRTVYAGTFTKDQIDVGQQVDFRDVVIQLEGVNSTRSTENGFISDDDDDEYKGDDDVDVVENKGESNDDDGSTSSEETENDGLVAAYRRAAHASDAGLSSNIRPNSEALSTRKVYAGTFTKDQLDGGQQVNFRDVVIQLEDVDGTRSTENGFISDDDDLDDYGVYKEDDDTGKRFHAVKLRKDKGQSHDDDGSTSSEETVNRGLDADYKRATRASDVGLKRNIPDAEALYSRIVNAGTFTKDQLDGGQQVDLRDVVIQLEGGDGSRSTENCFISDDDDENDEDYYLEDDDNGNYSHVDKHRDDGVEYNGDSDGDNGSTSSEDTDDDGLVADYGRAAHASDACLKSKLPDSEALPSRPRFNERIQTIDSADASNLRNNAETSLASAQQPRSSRHENDSKDTTSHLLNSTQTPSNFSKSFNLQYTAKGHKNAVPSIHHTTQDPNNTSIDSVSDILSQKLSTISFSNGDDLRSSSVEATRRRGTAAILSAANELISKTQSRMQIKSQISELQKILLSENNETKLNSLLPKEEIESSPVPLLDTATERLRVRKERLQRRRERIEQMRQLKAVSAVEGLDIKSMANYDDENRSDSSRNQALSEGAEEKGIPSTSSPNIYHHVESKHSSETSTIGMVDASGYRAGNSHHLSPTLEEKSRRRALMFQKFRLQLDKAKAVAASE